MRTAFIIFCLSAILLHSYGQELQCQININSQKVEGTDKRIFQTLQSALYEFLNNKKWTNRNFKMEERIECTLLLTINDRLGSEDFKGTLNVVVQRPVFMRSSTAIPPNIYILWAWHTGVKKWKATAAIPQLGS